MLDACARAGQMERAEKWLERMSEAAVQLGLNLCSSSGGIHVSMIRPSYHLNDLSVKKNHKFHKTNLMFGLGCWLVAGSQRESLSPIIRRYAERKQVFHFFTPIAVGGLQ